jgi:ubiquinone/menaquinone biosynthesis C-methylase UbiE
LKIDKNIAKEFTRYMEKYPILYKDIADKISNIIDDVNNKIYILDLGSGPGLLNKEIKKQLPNSVIYSLDQSIEMLTNAQTYTFKGRKEKINGILSNAEKIPIKSDSIDILVSRFSISYWKEPLIAIREIKRILKPKGKLIIEALNKDFPRWKLYLIKLHMIYRDAGNNVIRYHINAYKNAYNLVEIKKLLNKNDLNIIEIDGKKSDWKYTIISELSK